MPLQQFPSYVMPSPLCHVTLVGDCPGVMKKQFLPQYNMATIGSINMVQESTIVKVTTIYKMAGKQDWHGEVFLSDHSIRISQEVCTVDIKDDVCTVMMVEAK